jgi:hypothetical protein
LFVVLVRRWVVVWVQVGVACGPDVVSESASTGSGSGGAASSGTTDPPGTAGSEGSASSGGSSGSAAGSSGTVEASSGGSTGAKPDNCELDETPVGPGTIEWDAIEPDAHHIEGLALTSQGITAVGESSEDEDAAAIERFQLDGLPYWSRTWKATGTVDNCGVLALALPDKNIVAGVIAPRPNGSSEQWLVAYGPYGDIEWEAELDVGYRLEGDVSPNGTVVVVSELDDASAIVLLEIDADGAELRRTEHALRDDVNLRDIAVGPDADVIVVGTRYEGKGFSGWLARFDASHALESSQASGLADAIAVAENGDLLAVGSFFGTGTLQRLATDGSTLWTVDVESARDLTLDCAGRILVGARSHAHAFDGDGTLLWTTELEGGASQLRAAPSGDLFTTGSLTTNAWLTAARISGT